MNHSVLFKISIFSDMFKFITSLDILGYIFYGSSILCSRTFLSGY